MASRVNPAPLAEPRIFLTGTGGQGTLTATRILGEAALLAGLNATAGEIHGMAQRGGVVESCLLIGAWRSARVDIGEADILLGFEAMETLRALPYLKSDGVIFSSLRQIPPLSVALGEQQYPELSIIREECKKKAQAAFFLPCEEIGAEAGNRKAANSALLGAACASGYLPFGTDCLEKAIAMFMPEKIRAANLKAVQLGAEKFRQMNNEPNQ